MKKILKLGITLLTILLVVTGCAEANKESSSNKSAEIKTNKQEENIEKEITLYPEDMIEIKEGGFVKGRYYFNGFSDENTVSFTKSNNETIIIYQKAKMGLKFKLKRIENYEFTIVDFNREENYLKLKIKQVNVSES